MSAVTTSTASHQARGPHDGPVHKSRSLEPSGELATHMLGPGSNSLAQIFDPSAGHLICPCETTDGRRSRAHPTLHRSSLGSGPREKDLPHRATGSSAHGCWKVLSTATALWTSVSLHWCSPAIQMPSWHAGRISNGNLPFSGWTGTFAAFRFLRETSNSLCMPQRLALLLSIWTPSICSRQSSTAHREQSPLPKSDR